MSGDIAERATGDFPPPSGGELPPPSGGYVSPPGGGSVGLPGPYYHYPVRQPPPRASILSRWVVSARAPLLALAATAAVFGILGGRYPVKSVAMVLGVYLIAVVAVGSLVRRTDAALLIGVGTIAFGPWFMLRSSPWLLVVNTLAFMGLGVHALTMPTSIVRSSLAGYLSEWAEAIVKPFLGPGLFARNVRPANTDRAVGAVKRLAIPAAVVVLVFLVLALGDQLFASFFTFSAPDQIWSRFWWVVLGALWYLAAFGLSGRPVSTEADPPTRHGGEIGVKAPTVRLTVIGLSVVLSIYCVVQLSAAVLGADYVRGRTGLSFAEWARQGFASVVVAALISVTVLGLASNGLAKAENARRSTQLFATVLGLAVVGLATASCLKLFVYVDQYGLTMLRLYTIVFTLWLGVVAVLQIASVVRPGGQWVTSAVLISALVGAFAMNIVNPERLVMNTNIDRAVAGVVAPRAADCDQRNAEDRCYERFDPVYADNLSADGAVVAYERLDEMPDDVATELRERLCRRSFQSVDGLSYHLAEQRAGAARIAECVQR